MQQIRNACTNICLILVIFTACSRAVQYGIHVPKQTKSETTVNSTSINAIPQKTDDWLVVLQRAGVILVQHDTQETLLDEYKLHYAAYKGDATQLGEWIAANAQWINKPMNMDGNGNITPLHLAVFQGNIECVRLLLDKGADVRALMDKTNSYIQPIHIAAWGDALDVLRALISAQCAVVGDCDATGKTALHWAASQGHIHCVQELLQSGSNPNSEDQEGHTPLCFALEGNHPEVMAQLVNKDANIDCINYIHNSDRLLRCALAKKAYTCIAAVARKETLSVDLYREDAAGQTLFDCALKTDHPLSIRHLLWKESGDNWINYIDQNGTPLLHHTILGNHPKLLAALLATSTLTINAQDAAGRTALQLAAEKNLPSVVQQLLAVRGIDVNQKDKEGQTALYAAVAHEHIKVAEVLMQLPAATVLEGNEYNQTLLEAAFEANYISFVKKIFDAGEDDNTKDDLGTTLLHRAAETGRLEMMEALLKIKGIDINPADIDGNTPLHLAASAGHAPAVEVLVKVEGIEINAKNIDGNTPLHLAASAGHAAAVEALVKVPGIEVYATNKDGKTPLNLADANGHGSLAKVNGRPSVAASLLSAKNLGNGRLFQDPRNNFEDSGNEGLPPKRRKF